MPTILSDSILLVYLGTVHLACSGVIKPVLEISGHERNATFNGQVTETQYASCRVATENATADAHAAITRVLKGACDAKTVEEKFEKLEKNLTRELGEIKEILYAFLNHGSSSNILNVTNTSVLDRNFQVDYGLVWKDEDDDSLDNVQSPRQEEINQLNYTLHQIWTTAGSVKVFTYYWMVRNFEVKLERWKSTRSERSPTFYVGERGYAMYLRATPRYFPDGTTFVGLGLTQGRYDSGLEWPFCLRTRIEILDHSPEQQQQEDRKSRTWCPTTLCNEIFWGRPKLFGEPDNPVCVGLSVSRKIILARSPSSSPFVRRNEDFRYIWRGSLVIKLTVYM